jgi:hypothetical protein
MQWGGDRIVAVTVQSTHSPQRHRVKQREEETVKAARCSYPYPAPVAEHAGSREEEEESAKQGVNDAEVQQQKVVGSLDLQE